ncbi:MAG TPA: TIGR03435 family protein [Terriglobia bacterium]|jgi:uncharacterized protein (TIGR03435 family)
MRFRSLLVAAAVLLIWSISAFAQVPQFEVASIRPSGPIGQINTGINAGVHIDGAQVRFTLFNLISYIGYAYDVPPYQVHGLDWMGSAWFDISAKMPDGADTKQVRAMLGSLLEERFGLKAHRESREFPVYALEVARTGLKMNELAPDPALDLARQGGENISMKIQGNGGTYDLGNGAYFAVGEQGFEGKKLTMRTLCKVIRPFLDRDVVDMTNLKGTYDFQLPVTSEDRIAMMIRSAVNAGMGATLPPQMLRLLDSASGDSFAEALQKLGLVLVPRKAPLEVVVVDSLQKTPTEN